VLPEVVEALAAVPAGNASSPHSEGRKALAALDAARDTAAGALGVDPTEIVFTSSGTEAVNLALLGAGRRLPPEAAVVTWGAEHQAVLGAVRRLQLEGRRVEILPVEADGLNSEAHLPNAGLVSTSLANNEVGTVQPRAHAPGALVHLDACQGPQWLEVDLRRVDLASFSGHKLGAGQGGLLFVRSGTRLEPLIYGGPQQRGRRAGWEDVRAAVAMAAALNCCAERREAWSTAARPLGQRLRRALAGAGGRLTGAERSLPGHASAIFSGTRGEDLLLALDLAGVAASSGSACASGSLDPSHVLLAMGFSLEDSLSSLRLTAGWSTTEAEVERAETVLRSILAPLVRA
jgi:cysteine desulfurase